MHWWLSNFKPQTRAKKYILPHHPVTHTHRIKICYFHKITLIIITCDIFWYFLTYPIACHVISSHPVLFGFACVGATFVLQILTIVFAVHPDDIIYLECIKYLFGFLHWGFSTMSAWDWRRAPPTISGGIKLKVWGSHHLGNKFDY